MAIRIRGKRDPILDQIVEALERFQADVPSAKIEVYRQNVASVRVRVVDASFRGQRRGDRHNRVWSYLDSLPDEALEDVSLLILLTPDEQAESLANFEFEHPSSPVR